MKKGFYYFKTENVERCYYLTGEKKGNRWISLGGINGNEFVNDPDPQWMNLNWMCVPKKDDIKRCIYSEINPTKYLDIK